MTPGKQVYFFSDVHLGVPDHASSLAREQRLVAWLQHIAPTAEAVHIVGDLFDFWFEWRLAVPRGYVRILGQLAAMRDAGIPIYAYTGNHDLWYFGYFEEELGIPVYREPQTWTYGSHRFLVGHGDGIGPGDHGYKFIKRVFSNRLCQWAFARLHPNLAIGMALFWSRKSRKADADLDESFRGEAEAQVIYAREHQASDPHNFYVFGHRHCPARLPLDAQTKMVNLGDWIHHFSFGVYDGQDLQLRSWDGQAVVDMTGTDFEPGYRKEITENHA